MFLKELVLLERREIARSFMHHFLPMDVRTWLRISTDNLSRRLMVDIYGVERNGRCEQMPIGLSATILGKIILVVERCANAFSEIIVFRLVEISHFYTN